MNAPQVGVVGLSGVFNTDESLRAPLLSLGRGPAALPGQGSTFSLQGLPLISTFDGNGFKSTTQQSNVTFPAELAQCSEEWALFDTILQGFLPFDP